MLSCRHLRSVWLTSVDPLNEAWLESPERPDAVVLDVARSVSLGDVGAALERGRAIARSGVLVRLSVLASGRFEDELDAALPGRPDGVLLPGCSDGRDVQHCGVKLAVREAEWDIAPGSTAIVAVPNAAGLLRLDSFRGASPRLQGLVTGEFDAWEEEALTPAVMGRALLILGARAAAVPAFATMPPGASDPDARRCGEDARRFGFSGAITDNRSRIAALNAIFRSRP